MIRFKAEVGELDLLRLGGLDADIAGEARNRNISVVLCDTHGLK